MLWLYTALIYLVAPVALASNWWRARSDPAYGERLSERWGYTQARFTQRPFWIHAVSVGEVQASAVLVRALLKRYPGRPILMTTGTPTGAQRVKTLFGEAVSHAFLPYDMPDAVRRFLDRVRPALGIVMETEIWPNLFRECRRRGIPLVLVSARLSAKSVRRYSRLKSLTKQALSDVIIEAQSATDAERFVAIGAAASKTRVTGNVKFDIQIASELRADGQRIRAEQYPGRMVWIAASTHEGEEEAALLAHEEVLAHAHLSNALLIIVPRHPQRFDAVRSLLSSRAIPFAARSAGDRVDHETRVLLVDTMGELLMFYASADAAFVGGSLAPIGGHSLLEPAALGCAMLVGPHNFNAPEIAHLFVSAGAALQIKAPAELGPALVTLLGDPGRRHRMSVRAQEILEQNRGALERVLDRIEQLAIDESAER